MPIIPVISFIPSLVNEAISRPTNPDLVNRLTIRYVNDVIINGRMSHNDFIAMVRNAPQFTLHAPYPNAPEITTLDRLSTVLRLERISNLFNRMRTNRTAVRTGFAENADFANTPQFESLNQDFLQLFEMLRRIPPDGMAGELAVHADGPIRSAPGKQN